MAGDWQVVLRRRGRTTKERYDGAAQALAAVQRELDALARTERRGPAKAFVREVEPADQVAARAEVSGPRGARGGVDLRGDGTRMAWTGRWRRSPVEARRGEDAVDALRRALGV